MEEVAYMVCMRVDELDDPVEHSTTTACVECGDDIWISAASRKEMGKVGAMPVCSRCAARIAQEHQVELREMSNPFDGPSGEISDEQFAEIEATLRENGFGELLDAALSDDTDNFETMKITARLAGESMPDPDSDWGSMVIVENWEGFTFPPLPLSRLLAGGASKEQLAQQLIPAMATAAGAKRVLFGISSWSLAGKNMEDLTGRISDHPDKKEMLILLDVTADGVERMASAEILRDGINKPSLGEWHDSEKPDASSGLFVDVLVPTLQLIRSQRKIT